MAILPRTTLARVGLGLDLIALIAYLAVMTIGSSTFEEARAVGLGVPILALLVGAALVLVAIVRQGERALLAWLAMLPGAFFLLALLAELTGLME